MEKILCPKLYDNYKVMCDEFVAQKKSRISVSVARFLNADTTGPNVMDELKDCSVHPALQSIDIVQHIFDKVGREDRKNMVETCKKWAQWFLLSGPRSEYEYRAKLRRREHALCFSRFDGDVRVDTFCYCHDAVTVEEVEEMHAENSFPRIGEPTEPGYMIDLKKHPRYLDYLTEYFLDLSSDDES